MRKGLPARLAAYYDNLPNCMACVEFSPDWPSITWKIDQDAWEERYGREPKFETRGTAWSRDLEKRLRDGMRKGDVTKFSITLATVPCRCCPEDATKKTQVGYNTDKSFFLGTSGWDSDLKVHDGAGVIYTTPGQLGADPQDLTSLPESFRRSNSLKQPKLELAPPVRVVQPLCPDCLPIASEYNELGSQINDINKSLAKSKRDLNIVQQAEAGVWREIAGANELATTKETIKKLEDLNEELSQRQLDADRSKNKIRDAKKKILELQNQLRSVLQRLKDCEKNCKKQSAPPPKILIGSDSPTWCSFRDGNPTPSGGDGEDPRDTPPPDDGDDPGDTPPPGGGNDPRDTPTSVSNGNDPRDTPSQEMGGGPRYAPTPEEDDGAPRDTPVAGGSTTKEKEEEDDDDPRDAPVTIYVKAKASAVSAGSAAQATAGQKIKLFADSTTNVALPGNGAAKPQTDHDEEPIQGTTDSKGNLALTVPASAIGAKGGGGQSFEVSVDTTAQTSLVATPKAALPASLKKYVSDAVSVGSQQFTVLTLPKSQEKTVTAALDAAGIQWEINYCREKQAAVNDPLFKGKGAWKQKYDNQWAIKRVGLTNDGKTAWKKLGKSPKPVIVAVIDTGLDWNHLDIDWKNLWRNPKEIPNNGKDDDRNGYIDDVIGWDFYGRHNKPWDHDGHGTIVAGIIAATQNNKVGMAGINPHAKIMVLKALNSFGHSRASYLAKAITYAVDNGARIINMSVGGKEITSIEKQAVKYAISKGVLIVVASGNEGVDVKNYGIAGLDGVLSVGATDLKDKRAGFSNWGAAIDIAAPGIDVLSLRARRTDTMRDIPGVEYKNGANYVGKDKRYYRASGTSFAAPIVAGVASLVMSKHPRLSGEEVAQILKQTADDVDTPGVDQYSGHGIVNANKALEAEAGLFITANISGVQVAQGKKGPIVQVVGTAAADQFKKATIAIGAGEDPAKWKNVAKVKSAVKAGMLGEIDANELRSSTVWIIRLTVEHKNGKTQEFRFRLSLG